MTQESHAPAQELDSMLRELDVIAAAIERHTDPIELEDRVWRVYLKAEMLVALMKLDLSIERPGEFIVVPQRDHVGAYIKSSRESIAVARGKVGAKQRMEAFVSLRDGRNDLRAFLTAVRKMRVKAKR